MKVRTAMVSGFVILSAMAAPLSAQVVQDFDNAGSNYSLSNSSGAAAAVQAGGPTGNYLSLTHLSGSINNSIAFDLVPFPVGTTATSLSFDFRGSDDAANDAAGGCCGEAADGFAIGIFDVTGAGIGATGPSNPGAVANVNWENPTVAPGFPAGLVIGFDVFDNGAANPESNQIRIAYGGPTNVLYNAPAPFTLNDNLFHRVMITSEDVGTDTALSMSIIQDVHGTAAVHQVFSDVVVPGLDLDGSQALQGTRLIAGGRTGSAFVAIDLDNINYAAVTTVPEPGSIALAALAIAGSALAGWRRRRHQF